MEKKLLFLINPRAGKGEIRGKLLEILETFVRAGYEVTVHTTQRAMELPGLVAGKGPGYDLLVCCGGDGTLNETLSGLMECEKPPLLGYIPAGTVNDFATSLQIPKGMPQAAKAIVEGAPLAVDVGRFNSRYFAYVAAFGAFTDVAYQTPQQYKNIFGRAAYILEGIMRVPNLHAYHLRLQLEDRVEEGDYLLGLVANSTSVGGFKASGRLHVSMSDGLFEVVLVQTPKNAGELQATINALLKQEFGGGPVRALRARKLQISADEEIPWTLDGEFGGKVLVAQIENIPRALRIVAGREEGPPQAQKGKEEAP